MDSAIVVLERTVTLSGRTASLSKRRWRAPETVRRLPPVAIEALVFAWWREHRGRESWPWGIGEIMLASDGTTLASKPPRAAEPADSSGVLDLHFTGTAEVSVLLTEDASGRLSAGSQGPEVAGWQRPMRQVARLRPWRPVLVVLNGRGAKATILRDYHLVRCAEPMPEHLEAVRIVDLQQRLV